MGMGMGGGGGAMMMEANPVDYKLIRFYDFALDARDPNAAKPGRKYIYRVRFCVNDPNFPQSPSLQPKGNSLAPDVYDRYLKLVKIAETTKKREFRRWSDWSTPGAPVSLPSLSEFYAGPTKAPAPKPVKVGNRTWDYQAEPPTASMVLSYFDPGLSVKLNARVNVTEGHVFAMEPESVDVVDPITLDVKKVEKPAIESYAAVVDIDGGAPLSIQEGEDMIEPGMMLIFDPTGGLQVHDEVGDQELYRIKSFAKERGE